MAVMRFPRLRTFIGAALVFLLGIGAGTAYCALSSPLAHLSSADKEWYLDALRMYCLGHGYADQGAPCMELLRDGSLTLHDLYAYRERIGR